MGQHQVKQYSHLGIPKEEEREEEQKTYSKIMAENFPNLGKEKDIQIKDSQKVSNKRNPKRSTSNTLYLKC